jgi:hypothetical protein
MTNRANPLAKHFRQPALYLSLPSRGRFYPEGGLELSTNGTLPVYPMTVKDELVLKTPDALLNGQGVIDVIKSCCPGIKDPWDIPAVDLDPIFIAMRLASYGKSMDFTSTCPHCKETNEYSIDLNVVLDNLGKADYSKIFEFDGLIFKFRPQKYKNINRIGMINFEQEKLIQQVIQNETMTEEEKMVEFKKGFDKISSLTLDSIIDSIDSITTVDGVVVSDHDMIEEYLNSCSRMVYDFVKTTIGDLAESFKIKPMNMVCDNEECQKEFETNLSFDHSNFFG